MNEAALVQLASKGGSVGVWTLVFIALITLIKGWPALKKMSIEADGSLGLTVTGAGSSASFLRSFVVAGASVYSPPAAGFTFVTSPIAPSPLKIGSASGVSLKSPHTRKSVSVPFSFSSRNRS